jgi:hypothetical protein
LLALNIAVPKKPETLFREKVTPLLKALPFTHVFSIQQVAIRGTPDMLLCIAGHFVALEFKKDERSKPTALQRHALEKVEKAGGSAFVVCPENWGNIYRHLRSYATMPHHV